jgi:heme exporter protein B
VGWRGAAAILAKDLKLELRRVETVATMAVFAVLVVLVFVFAGDPTPADLGRLGPGALWISLLFAGKWAGATIFLLGIECALVPVTLTMYQLDLTGSLSELALLLVVVTIGYSALGTFFAAVAAKTSAGELLLPILLFPLSVPLVLAGAEGGQALVEGGRMGDYWSWLSLAFAFDVIFGTVCTLAFEYVIEE